MVQEKTERWSLTKKHGYSRPMCRVRWSLHKFISIGKSKDNMNPIKKTNINDISNLYAKINFQIVRLFLKGLHLSRLWEFCHAKSALVSFHTFRNGYCGGKILLKINRWIFPRYSQLCWITIIFRDAFVKKKSCTISHQKFIFTVMLKQVMYVAVNMNYQVICFSICVL